MKESISVCSLHACIFICKFLFSFAPFLSNLLLNLFISLIKCEFFTTAINKFIIVITVLISQCADVAFYKKHLKSHYTQTYSAKHNYDVKFIFQFINLLTRMIIINYSFSCVLTSCSNYNNCHQLGNE